MHLLCQQDQGQLRDVVEVTRMVDTVNATTQASSRGRGVRYGEGTGLVVTE